MIFWNDFLPSRFSILKTFFAYGTLIPETLFVYEIPIPESPKIINNNSDILNNIGVQEENCRGAGRSTPPYIAVLEEKNIHWVGSICLCVEYLDRV